LVGSPPWISFLSRNFRGTTQREVEARAMQVFEEFSPQRLKIFRFTAGFGRVWPVFIA
jgi:hypothetical protein